MVRVISLFPTPDLLYLMTTSTAVPPLVILFPYWSFNNILVVFLASGYEPHGDGAVPLLVLVSDIATDVATGAAVVVVVVVVGATVVVVVVVLVVGAPSHIQIP